MKTPDSRLNLVVPPEAAPEVQVEIVRTFRSMQRWDAIKNVLGVVAVCSAWAASCWAVCVP